MAILLPYTYLGPIEYYQRIARKRAVTLERHENFPKQTYRNRCTIYGANGPLDLIVPTVHVSGERSMNLRKISYEENWQKLHWKSFETAYRSSSFFEYYEDDFEAILMKKHELLLDLNSALMNFILDALKLEIEINATKAYEEEFDGDDLRDSLDPKIKSEAKFERYQQVFEDRHGFIADLSIVDLLFNQGPNAREYIVEEPRELETE